MAALHNKCIDRQAEYQRLCDRVKGLGLPVHDRVASKFAYTSILRRPLSRDQYLDLSRKIDADVISLSSVINSLSGQDFSIKTRLAKARTSGQPVVLVSESNL